MTHGAPAMHAELNNNYVYTFLLFCVLPCLALIIADTSSPSQDDSKLAKNTPTTDFGSSVVKQLIHLRQIVLVLKLVIHFSHCHVERN
jgi:hypothetical protein